MMIDHFCYQHFVVELPKVTIPLHLNFLNYLRRMLVFLNSNEISVIHILKIDVSSHESFVFNQYKLYLCFETESEATLAKDLLTQDALYQFALE